MDYPAAIDFLDSRIGTGVKPGLERITGLLDMMARPDAAYPIVHVAGSNGKTSTTRMVESIVAAHGLRSGSFTSPHLDAVEQRFQLDGAPMTADQFAEAMGSVAPIIEFYEERFEPVTYFEVTAALAFWWLADGAADVGVIETGLGGRWDATNAANSKVAVVTNISLEHTEYLGDTITAIAEEKLAILDTGADLVTGDLHPDALAVAGRVAAEREARWFRWGEEFRPDGARAGGGGWQFDLHGVHGGYSDIELRLRGRHQVANFAVAVAAVEALLDRPLDEGAVHRAAQTVTTPGRLDVVDSDPLLVLDGAHNPGGMEALASSLHEEFPGVAWTLVFGAMRDKDIGRMLGALRGLVRDAHVAAAGTPRALAGGEVASLVFENLGVPVAAHDSVAGAVAAARGSGGPVLVTGSIYVVGEARRALGLA